MYRLFNVVYKKTGCFESNFTSVDVVSAYLLVDVVSTGFFFLQPHVHIFLRGVSQFCAVHSKKFVTYLAPRWPVATFIHSSPAGLLGRQRVDIGYKKLKLTSARPTMVTRS